MKLWLKILGLLGFLSFLSACGFHPMYADNGAGANLTDTFSQIEVATIPNRLGQNVRNHLLDRLNPYGQASAPNFRLEVDLNPEFEGFGFRQDEAITRENLTLEGSFRLLNLDTGEVVFADSVRAVQAYDVVQSDFANFSARQDAELRTAELLSDLITARLGMYFKARE